MKLKIMLLRHPEWWAWCLSLLIWLLLMSNAVIPQHEMNVIYCMPGATIVHSHSASFISGMLPWMVMIVAMMFPLLTEPVRHVAFSIRRADRLTGILLFLLGYTLTWTAAGVVFMWLLSFLDTQNAFVQSSGFFLAAILIWLPGRPERMIKCSQTMPIRIYGWRLYRDSMNFGLQMGLACLNVCWAVMAALMLSRHNLALMFIATVILIYERYLLKHTNKLPGYAWGILGLTLFIIEICG